MNTSILIIIIALLLLELIRRISVIDFPVDWFRKSKFNNLDSSLFNGKYIEARELYATLFKLVPSINFVTSIDQEKVKEYIDYGRAGKVLEAYKRRYYNWQKEKVVQEVIIYLLENKLLIEIGYEYVEILYSRKSENEANDLYAIFTLMKAPDKEEESEINIITQNSHGLDLKQLDIKESVLDIDLYYNDDFKAVDAVIRERLDKENDKGIILLHGLPGTGKTTYLRHLIGEVKKKILFVSPAVAGNLMNPEFIDLLIDNPNSILVIEDAENIIMDRKYSPNSSVSNLLNISDGLMSDCLNVQIICTFNSALNMVDSALLRKGRLIAKYEFGKLGVTKAQRLSDHLKKDKVITEPMTLAEISNPDDMMVEVPAMKVLGFRREEALMN